MPVLQFKGKTAIESYHHTIPHHTLEFDAKLSILAKGEKTWLDGNLIIEGDNLIALKALLPTHAGRIKCIYIDPPYNTGNEGWVYNDNLTQPQFKEWIGQTVGKEGEDATRHDKWCCMMYPRLQLLKEFLTDDGVIFISVDDNEAQHLRLIMDEIYGAERLLAMFVWKSRENPDSRNKTGISIDHEYVLAYGKSESAAFLGKEKDLSKYKNPDNDPNGPWMSDNLTGLASAEERPNLHYPIVDPATDRKYLPPRNRGWSKSKEVMNDLINKGQIIFPRNPNSRPRLKHYVKDLLSTRTGFSTVLLRPYTTDGTRELMEIFGEKVFAFPKPSEFIKTLIQQVTMSDDIILDSFAGSGPTAQAVMKINREDDGNRKFLLIQLPFETKEQEKTNFNICQMITSERIRRVINGYTYTDTGDKKEKVAGIGGSFTYARVGKPLFGEYRDWGKQMPAYEEVAKYIFYTETSRDFDRAKMNEKTGKIGEHHGTSYYLLYTPNGEEDRRLDTEWLRALDKAEKNRKIVVYCEKKWIHPDDLAKYELETRKTVRPMIVPFNLK